MNNTIYKRRSAAFRPAAVLAVLACLSLFLAAPAIVRVKADVSTGDEALIVLQNNTGDRWSQLSEANIFADPAYGGRQVIAPSSSGEYAFTVQNSARFPLRYCLNISDENEAGVPMEFRLKQGENYITGSDWVDVSALSEICSELPYESEAIYFLQWHWAENDDEADTKIGVSAQDGKKYILHLEITAEQSGEAVDPPPQTGDSFNIAFWLALAILSGILLILIKRRTNDDEDRQNI